MLVDFLGEYVGDTLPQLLPLEDGTVEVVFVEVAGEDIDGLIFPSSLQRYLASCQYYNYLDIPCASHPAHG